MTAFCVPKACVALVAGILFLIASPAGAGPADELQHSLTAAAQGSV